MQAIDRKGRFRFHTFSEIVENQKREVTVGALPNPLPNDDSSTLLAPLGLTLADCRWVMSRILDAGRGQSAYALATKAGTDRYHTAIVALRERAIPKGFTMSEAHNIGRVVAPDRSFQIIVGQGDENTATELMPCTRRKRGPKGKELVLPSLFPREVMRVITNVKNSLELPTRVLLYYARTDVIRAELSVPVDLDAKGRYSKFIDRIPLGEITPDGIESITSGFPPVPPTDIEFSVKRRER